jgi:leukotriene-A4 hydrolase
MINLLALAATFTVATARFNVTSVPADYVPQHPACDNSTYGNVEELATSHYHIDWNIDFDNSIIKGSVVHDLVAMIDNVAYLQLDIWNIDVTGVFKVDTNAATLLAD